MNKQENNPNLTSDHVCPWWMGYTFDNPLRRLFQNPQHILAPYVQKGDTVMDIGCGMGFYSIAMAQLVGRQGCVVSVDIQQQMLNILKRRARKKGLAENIVAVQGLENVATNDQTVDFCLTFWMLHEVPDKRAFLGRIYHLLKPSGQYLLVEPKIHNTPQQFEEEIHQCTTAGFLPVNRPVVGLSRSALFKKP